MNSNNPLHKLMQVITPILIFFLFTRPPVDADLWWHLRAGQVMWEQHHILLTDIFSYTRAGTPWVNAFWISEIIFYLLQKVGGYFALTVFTALMGSLTFYVVQRRLAGNPFVNGFALLLAALTAAPVWAPRPQIISFLLIAVLDDQVASKSKKWFMPLFFALWANIHGGWIWGFLLLAAHIGGLAMSHISAEAEDKSSIWLEIKSLSGWTVISALAIGLNPNGLSIWALPFEQVNVSLQIQEWLSPDFHRIDFHPFLWMIFLLVLISPFQSRVPHWTGFFKVLGFAYLTFVAQRNIALFAITAVPLLADWSNRTLSALKKVAPTASPANNSSKFKMIINSLMVLILALIALGNAFVVSQPAEVDKNYPINAIRWMQDNAPQGRLFNAYNWGGYILWNLQDYPVFIDGRADLYGNEIISEWQSVMNAQDNALTILDNWEVNTVFVESHAPIVQLLEINDWKIVFQDDLAVILVRE